MPQPIVDLLSSKVIDILKRPDVASHVQQIGIGLIAGGPEVLRARIVREVPIWHEVIANAHLKLG